MNLNNAPGLCQRLVASLPLLLLASCSSPARVPLFQSMFATPAAAAPQAPPAWAEAAPPADPAPQRRVMQQASWPAAPTPGAPTSWPQPDMTGPGGTAPPQSNPLTQQDPSDLFGPSVTVATVGDQYIQKGELVGDANIMLAPYLEKLSPEEVASKRAEVIADRDRLTQQLLRSAIERKLMYLEFLRGIPQDKLAEAKANIKERIGTAFETELDAMIEKVQKTHPDDYQDLAREDAQLFRLAFLMKEQNLTTHRQLETFLRRYGSSLEKQKQSYAERKLGQQALVSKIDAKPEITHEEMLEYYRAQSAEFEVPHQARWEQLTARFDHFRTREDCRNAIAAMGNEVWLGGAPLAAVAKRSSQGPNAEQGGYHDWTDWGDLEVSREVQEKVFSLPPGKLSPIFEDSEGLHIVRVIEQRAAHMIPFADAQATIKEKLQIQKRNEQVTEFLAKLRKQTPIWTMYDGTIEPDRVASPPSGAGANASR